MKDKVIVFKKEVGARIYVNPGEDFIQALRQDKIPFLVNPDLTTTSGIPPEKWILKNNKIAYLDDKKRSNKKEPKLVLYKTPKIAKLSLVVTSLYIVLDVLFKLGLI
jgi:hypothetical protein